MSPQLRSIDDIFREFDGKSHDYLRDLLSLLLRDVDLAVFTLLQSLCQGLRELLEIGHKSYQFVMC